MAMSNIRRHKHQRPFIAFVLLLAVATFSSYYLSLQFLFVESQNGLKPEIPLQHQLDAQQEFQDWIHKTQYPPECKTARILTLDKGAEPYDGFALELQFLGMYLRMAVATERALVLPPLGVESAYAPPNCNWNDPPKQDDVTKSEYGLFTCLFSLPSPCTEEENIGGRVDPSTLTSPSSVGIINDEGSYFAPLYYGPTRVVEEPDHDFTRTIDRVPMWERLYGRFWIRAQLAHYIWERPNPAFREQIMRRLPPLTFQNEPFLAFHIRLTDNAQDLEHHFGRNATLTRSLERFMLIAENIRRTQAPMLQHIHVATDNRDIVKQLRSTRSPYSKTWQFHWQQDVQRSKSHSDHVWFGSGRSRAAGAIAADLEILRRADYLVGSFQSNVYRLATELNTCWHAGKYAWSAKRHYAVDIEWYEDP